MINLISEKCRFMPSLFTSKKRADPKDLQMFLNSHLRIIKKTDSAIQKVSKLLRIFASSNRHCLF